MCPDVLLRQGQDGKQWEKLPLIEYYLCVKHFINVVFNRSLIHSYILFFFFKSLLCVRLAVRNKTGNKTDKVSAHSLILVLYIK